MIACGSEEMARSFAIERRCYYGPHPLPCCGWLVGRRFDLERAGVARTDIKDPGTVKRKP